MERRRLLSFDGGGVRGLSSLYILQHIMLKMKVLQKLPEEPRPCDYFDMIAGNSTGGIIAIMLGRLRMTASECIVEYLRLSEYVFGTENAYTKRTQYDALRLETAIGDVVQARTGDRAAPLLDPTCTKTFVIAVNTSAADSLPVLFRSYDSGEASPNSSIVQAARATSAALTFFPAMQIEDETYTDGGIGMNNPSRKVLEEVQDICRLAGQGFVLPDVLLSIGTGQMDLVRLETAKRASWWKDRTGLSFAQAIVSLLTNCHKTHLSMQRSCADWGIQNRYFRLEVLKGLEDVALDEYQCCADIKAVTRAFLRGLDESREPERCASALVAVGPSTRQSGTFGSWPFVEGSSVNIAGRNITRVHTIEGDVTFN